MQKEVKQLSFKMQFNFFQRWRSKQACFLPDDYVDPTDLLIIIIIFFAFFYFLSLPDNKSLVVMRSQLFRTSQSVTFIWISDEIVFSILKITNKKFLILFLNIIIWNNISMIKITVKETPFYSVIKITVIFSFCFGNLPIHMSSHSVLLPTNGI